MFSLLLITLKGQNYYIPIFQLKKLRLNELLQITELIRVGTRFKTMSTGTKNTFFFIAPLCVDLNHDYVANTH